MRLDHFTLIDSLHFGLLTSRRMRYDIILSQGSSRWVDNKVVKFDHCSEFKSHEQHSKKIMTRCVLYLIGLVCVGLQSWVTVRNKTVIS